MYEDKNGPVKLVNKIEPTYKGVIKLHKPKLDKMGRRKPEKHGMSEETANKILDERIARHLNNF